ncbi:hypothetical protein [Knoellia sp. p5-6-4]|uniref:hypothetical protein n=1 Tax=unclassified Knoellia TaxID=2618719 RepID=UPI0023DA077A|nr:hypothetical protein [Knoellia sp. p5-6-4]MDF2145345.1 hypothetical protein [Knoellia sp. p5-6-4]
MGEVLLPKVHIDYLVTVALAWPRPWGPFDFAGPEGVNLVVTPDTATAVGDLLWRANYEWAADGEDYPGYRFEASALPIEPVRALRALSGYEGNVYVHAAEARLGALGFVDYLRSVAISRLPGWDDLPWIIGDD